MYIIYMHSESYRNLKHSESYRPLKALLQSLGQAAATFVRDGLVSKGPFPGELRFRDLGV